MVPIDEPRVRGAGIHAHEDFFRPEVAVQKGIGPAMLLHEPNAPRGVLKECMQAVQQARPRGRELRWRVAWEVRKRVKRIDGVPEVREEEGHPMVAGAAADLGYERVARRTGAELGDKIHCLLHPPPPAPRS